MGRYGEVKSVYLGKFKRRVHHTCHHNVIVYQQGAAQLRSESIVCLLVLHTHTPEHRRYRYTPLRDQYKSKYSAHTITTTPWRAESGVERRAELNTDRNRTQRTLECGRVGVLRVVQYREV